MCLNWNGFSFRKIETCKYILISEVPYVNFYIFSNINNYFEYQIFFLITLEYTNFSKKCAVFLCVYIKKYNMFSHYLNN